jgi:hypothetical protein
MGSLEVVRFGNTLGWPFLPPSQEPSLVHTNILSLSYENPHSYTNLPITTFNRDKKSNYLKLTTTEIDSQPDKRDQAVTTPQKYTEQMIITRGSSVLK